MEVASYPHLDQITDYQHRKWAYHPPISVNFLRGEFSDIMGTENQILLKVLCGESSYDSSPKTINCPVILSLAIRLMALKSSYIDQEVINVIVQKKERLYVLSQPFSLGYYNDLDGYYSAGKIPIISGATTICDLHSHTPGYRMLRKLQLSDEKLNRLYQVGLNFPSELDLVALLYDSGIIHKSRIIVGSDISFLLVRSVDSPPIRNDINAEANLFEELRNCVSNKGWNFSEIEKERLRYFSEKYKCIVYYMPSNPSNVLESLRWLRLFP